MNSPSVIVPLRQVGRLPEPQDNVAVATQRLEAGTRILDPSGAAFTLTHTLLEGHRFAVCPIGRDEYTLSWGLPFGTALRDIAPGEYLCNAEILEALRVRNLDFPLPDAPNFRDRMEPYRFDEQAFTPGKQVEGSEPPLYFSGYPRSGGRGVGTRNHIVLLGTTSQTGSFVRRLEERMNRMAEARGPLDRIVAVAHTEGGTGSRPNNMNLLLRTLAGFMTHPNVGAVLAVDYGVEAVTNAMLRAYMEENGYPLDDLTHAFFSIGGRFEDELDRAAGLVASWFEPVSRMPRQEVSISHLRVALQCGGSDAFSGISANPLAGWVARALVRAGGSANLAETDELIGAEPYVLDNVRDVETAQTFLMMIERFKERAAWHGQTVDANPSGGNKFRGIYNIVLKSIGAARKKAPDVRLDYAIDYGAPMIGPGYYFMDSPGNDLESIAGQVASGCNLIFFTTGNGSITNFPFVPTIKMVTTTRRYELLAKDMDVNAGAYLDGIDMDRLGQETLDLTLNVASGTRTTGEKAGHAQVSIWRNWAQSDARNLDALLGRPAPSGQPLRLIPASVPVSTEQRVRLYRAEGGTVADRVGLILPTSLCSGQIARMAAERLNAKETGRAQGLSRFVALVHTEGCGVSGGPSEQLYARAMTGYLTHPSVACALLLEHGCERTHNDYYRQQLRQRCIDESRFGWASVQLDGGIERVLDRIERWFDGALSGMAAPETVECGLEGLRVGLHTSGDVTPELAESLAVLVRAIVETGGTVVIPDNATLLRHPAFQDGLIEEAVPTLAYGQASETPGLHIMESQTGHRVETLAGLGAVGVEILLDLVGDHPGQGHPMIPVIQVGTGALSSVYYNDVDLVLDGDSRLWTERMLDLVCSAAGRMYTPRAVSLGHADFQITRGLLGVSM